MASIINGESSPGYYVTPTGITIGGRTKEYATIADMLADTNPGKFARVADATGDTTVKSGAAIYRREGTDWVKVYEEESMDIESKITWDTLSGAPEVTAEQVVTAVTDAHTHSNGPVLEKIGVDTNGNLTLDGNIVGGDAGVALSRLNVVEPIVSGLQNTVDAHATSIGSLETDKHNHSNKSVLDQLSVSNGQLQLNGVNVDSTADLSDYATKTDVSDAVGAISIPSDVSDLTDNQGLLGVSAWNDITGKPESFTPAAHSHVVADITNLSIPGDLSDLTDNSNILGGKQSAITGTAGQFVKIGNDGTVVAETVDMSAFGTVKTVNGVSPDATGNVAITVGTDVDLSAYYTSAQTDTAISSAVATETGLREAADTALSNRTTVLESAKETMAADISAVTGLAGNNTATITVHETKISALEEDSHTHNTTTNYVFVNEVFGCTEKVELYKTFKQFETDANISFDNKIVAETGYILIGNDKLFWTYCASGKYTNILEDLTGGISGFTVAAASNNTLAAISGGSLYVRSLGSAQTAIPAAGNLLGETTTLSNTEWTVVPGKSDWKDISCHIENWLAIDNNGNLYGAGKNYYGLQMNDLTTGVVNTMTLLDDSGDWIGIGTGRYHNMGMRGTIVDGVKRGTLYAWGQTHTGCIGNGISYRQDMKNTYGWTGNGVNVHTFAAKPAAGATVYTFEGKMVIVGHTTEASDGTSIIVDGVTYTRNNSVDLIATSLYVKTPTPIAAETYDAKNNVTGTTVYNDWFAFSTGYYHNAALRKNEQGKTEVYLWGDNEYGQFGNGNFVDDTLQQSSLNEEAATRVELWSYATRINDARFDDAIEVRCSHYGTFIKCESGKWYFAGCNKRNYLGTGTYSQETAFIPWFTELSTMFRNNDILVATYGSMVIRNSPRLSDAADPVIRAALTYPLEPGQIDTAVTAAHNHSIDTSVIDAAAILVNQFANDIPGVVTSKHLHNNLSDLSAISIQNGVLKINGVPYISGGSSSGGSAGTGVTVDPTNLQLDSLTDVAGLSNLAGGFGLEILSYRKVSDNDAYIQVAPNGGVQNLQGRYVDLCSNDGTEILTAAVQSKGLYAVPSNGTAGFIYSSKDLANMMETVAKAGSATLRLYYVDVAHATNPTAGTQVTDDNGNAITFTGSTLAGYLPLKWKLATGSTVNRMEIQDVQDLQSVGLGHYSNEEPEFATIYKAGDSGGYVELITKAQFDANTYYFEDGTEVKNIGSIVVPTGSVDSGEVDDEGNPVLEITYHSIYSDDTATTEVVSSDVIKNGIFIKDGTMMVAVKQYMIPETFDRSLFGNSSIYIHPGTANFSGMANQAYTFNEVAYTEETTAVDGVYPIKTAILRLTSAITDGDPNSTTEFTAQAGSIDNPMVAAIYNQNRFSTSSVNGEYNSAVGFNSSATGNQVTVTGDFSNATGLCDVVTGDMSQVDGFRNVVIGSNANVKGDGNVVAGYGNYAFGSGNVMCSYYAYAFGEGNTSLGVRGLLVGRGNFTHSDSTAIGHYNRLEKGSKNSIAVGGNLKVYAEGATVIGQVATVNKFDGFFPGEDTDTLYSITADSYAAAGYDTKWISFKNALVFGAGHKEGQDVTDIAPITFTKYVVRPNNAFFSASTGSTNRGSIDPYIYEPFLQHNFVGVISMQFTNAVADANNATKFTFTKRDGGRVKSFDPGIEVTDASSTTIDIDFNKATRWKLKDTVNTNVLIPKNFVDGAEAYVIVYGGVTVSWSAFAQGGNIDESEDANHFDGIVWADGSEPRSVDSMSTGFQMIKLMVVDNTVVGELVVDTCN